MAIKISYEKTEAIRKDFGRCAALSSTSYTGLHRDCFQKEIFHCFPSGSAYRWNIRHFGPLYVPGKGSEVAIDTQKIQ
jgi:hypothetical protein